MDKIKVADVEMEFLIAVQVTLLTIYDTAKAENCRLVMGDIRLLEKSGGKFWEVERGEVNNNKI